MLRNALVFISLVIAVKVCSAQEDIPCYVTQDGGSTLYSIPEFNATHCLYQWMNSTNHVLANEGNRVDKLVVVMKSDRTLRTHKCLELVFYSRSCISEGRKLMGSCTTNCSEDAGLQNGREILEPSSQWIIGISLGLLGLVGLVALVGLLGYRFRDAWSRSFTVGAASLRCFYSSVKTQNDVVV